MKDNYADYEWFLKKDFSEYSGKWLAIIDKKLVASGRDVDKVIKEAKSKYPTKKPLITKVNNKLSVL